MNRWRVVIGGVSMNLALGSLYAWSVFVAPLEKEFGWTRAQTSLVYTIAIVCFALSFVVAGRIQDLKGPRICAAIGGVLVSAGFFLASWTNSLTGLYLCLGVIVGLGNGFGYATPMPVASKWFPDKRGLVVGLMVAGYGAGSAILGPLATRLIGTLGWRPTVQILGGLFFVMTMIGTALMRNPPAGLPSAELAAQAWRSQAGADLTTREMLAHADVLFHVGGVLPRHDGRADGHQPARALRGFGGARRAGGDARAPGQRHRQRKRPNSVRVDVRYDGPAAHASGHGPAVGDRHADALHVARAAGALLRARGACLLVLRHAIVGVRIHDGRLLRHQESRAELRRPVHGVGRRRHSRAR